MALRIQQGAANVAVAALPDLIAADPWRERLWALLMRGYYVTGRQVEALDTYQRVRNLMIDELGVEPGPELRRPRAPDPRPGPRPVGVRAGAPGDGVGSVGGVECLGLIGTVGRRRGRWPRRRPDRRIGRATDGNLRQRRVRRLRPAARRARPGGPRRPPGRPAGEDRRGRRRARRFDRRHQRRERRGLVRLPERRRGRSPAGRTRCARPHPASSGRPRPGCPPGCAVGVHTGLALFRGSSPPGHGSGAEPGRTPAARRRAAEVLLSAQTAALVAAGFMLSPAGRPIALPSDVTAVAVMPSCRTARRSTETGRLTGRTVELARLAALDAAAEPAVVAILGEAGIGKSALAADYLAELGPGRFRRGGGPRRPAPPLGVAVSDRAGARRPVRGPRRAGARARPAGRAASPRWRRCPPCSVTWRVGRRRRRGRRCCR